MTAAISTATAAPKVAAGKTTRKSPTTARPATGGALWVSPTGNDKNVGTSRAQALRTVTAAWQRIPQGSELRAPVVINVTKGTYQRVDTPNYWEARHGTKQAPITIVSVDGPRAATFLGDMNVFDVRH